MVTSNPFDLQLINSITYEIIKKYWLEIKAEDVEFVDKIEPNQPNIIQFYSPHKTIFEAIKNFSEEKSKKEDIMLKLQKGLGINIEKAKEITTDIEEKITIVKKEQQVNKYEKGNDNKTYKKNPIENNVKYENKTIKKDTTDKKIPQIIDKNRTIKRNDTYREPIE